MQIHYMQIQIRIKINIHFEELKIYLHHLNN